MLYGWKQPRRRKAKKTSGDDEDDEDDDEPDAEDQTGNEDHTVPAYNSQFDNT